MSLQFIPGQVAVGDPSPGGPNANSQTKDVQCKIVKLTSANFGTVAVNTLVAVLSADSMITGMKLWVKTQLAGGSISAATYSVGLTSGGTDFVSAVTAFAAAGTYAVVTPISAIMQNYQVPLGTDLRIYVSGAATTGNPTSGELYLEINYVR